MTNIAQVLRDARALIDTPDKWTKGKFENGGCYCALGAVAKVCGFDPRNAWLGEMDAVHRALDASLPFGFEATPDFNDHRNTTHADVMALFDRAIAAAEVEKQS